MPNLRELISPATDGPVKYCILSSANKSTFAQQEYLDQKSI